MLRRRAECSTFSAARPRRRKLPPSSRQQHPEREHQRRSGSRLLCGHSTGCIMAQRMAIDASDIVAAVGCHAGYIMKQNYPYWNNAAQTPPSGFVPRPVMEIRAASIPPSHGPHRSSTGRAPAQPGLVGPAPGCPGYTAGSPAPTTTYTVSGEQYIRHQYTGCTGHEAVLIELPNARHMPFQGQDTAIDTAQIAWDFMRRFSRNGELLPLRRRFQGRRPLHRLRMSRRRHPYRRRPRPSRRRSSSPDPSLTLPQASAPS